MHILDKCKDVAHYISKLLSISSLIFIICSVPFSLLAETFKISAPLISKQAPQFETLIIQAYQELNIQVEIIRMPAKRALAESSKNTWVDAELARVAEAEVYLPNFIRIATPLMTAGVNSYSLKNDIDISDWQSLKNYHVVTLRGLIGITSKLKQTNIVFHETSTVEQAIKMLKMDRMDILVLPELLLNEDNLAHLASAGPLQKKTIAQFEVFHFIHKRHENLVPQLTLNLQKQLKK